MTICVENLTIVLYLAEAADVHNDERGEDKNAESGGGMNCRVHLHELKADAFMNCPAGMGCAPLARDMNGCAVVICHLR